MDGNNIQPLPERNVITKATDNARQSPHDHTKLDRKLAFLVINVPTLGTLLAIVLCFFGYFPNILHLSLFVVFYIATVVGLEVGFHRHLAHKAFKANRLVRKTLIILGCMGVHGPPIWWTAVHRHHHITSDSSRDPHSPHLSGEGIKGLMKGIYHSHMGWLLRGTSTRPPNWHRLVRDLYGDPLVLSIHMHYFRWAVIGLILPAVIAGLVGMTVADVLMGFLWGGVVRMFAVNNCIWALNSFCHVIGRQSFDTGGVDKSKNSFFLALLTFGEGWHNNHHAFPYSAYTGIYWWQVDFGGMVVRALKAFGLVWDVRFPSKNMIEKKAIN